MLRFISAALVAIALSVSLTPSASADPAGQLAGLTEVGDDARYDTYHDYGRYFSRQFATPDGVRCRIYGRHWQPEPMHVDCWGELPGTDANHAIASEGWGSDPSFAELESSDISYSDKSLSTIDGEFVNITYGASDYAILQPGTKITGAGSSCGVTAHEIICINTRERPSGSTHVTVGFVLSPNGSYTF